MPKAIVEIDILIASSTSVGVYKAWHTIKDEYMGHSAIKDEPVTL